jgi:hypothetical protein
MEAYDFVPLGVPKECVGGKIDVDLAANALHTTAWEICFAPSAGPRIHWVRGLLKPGVPIAFCCKMTKIWETWDPWAHRPVEGL